VAGAVHNIEDQGLAMPAIHCIEWAHDVSERVETEMRAGASMSANLQRTNARHRRVSTSKATDTATLPYTVRLLESSNGPRVS
jgi:hypothetical protein